MNTCMCATLGFCADVYPWKGHIARSYSCYFCLTIHPPLQRYNKPFGPIKKKKLGRHKSKSKYLIAIFSLEGIQLEKSVDKHLAVCVGPGTPDFRNWLGNVVKIFWYFRFSFSLLKEKALPLIVCIHHLPLQPAERVIVNKQEGQNTATSPPSPVYILYWLCLKISPHIQTTGAVRARSAATPCAWGQEAETRRTEKLISDCKNHAAVVNSVGLGNQPNGCVCEVGLSDDPVIRETCSGWRMRSAGRLPMTLRAADPAKRDGFRETSACARQGSD